MKEDRELKQAQSVRIVKPATLRDDVYDAVIEDIKEYEGTKYQSDEPQMNYIWEFAVAGEGGTVEASGFIPFESYKLYDWICTWPDTRDTYNGIPAGEPYDFDPMTFIGRECRVDIKVNDAGKAKVVGLRPPKA